LEKVPWAAVKNVYFAQNIILSEVSQVQKTKNNMFFLIYRVQT
jgi:hypothetical protein